MAGSHGWRGGIGINSYQGADEADQVQGIVKKSPLNSKEGFGRLRLRSPLRSMEIAQTHSNCRHGSGRSGVSCGGGGNCSSGVSENRSGSCHERSGGTVR